MDRPKARNLFFQNQGFTVELSDGRLIDVPLARFPRLRNATPLARERWELLGQGVAIHWPDLDEDIGVEGLLAPEQILQPRPEMLPEYDFRQGMRGKYAARYREGAEIKQSP